MDYSMFNVQEDYKRMGVPNRTWAFCGLNSMYELCDTYPAHIFLPSEASTEILVASSVLRSDRLPVLSYLHANMASISRCCQRVSGLVSRCTEDERLIKAIKATNPKSKFMYMVCEGEHVYDKYEVNLKCKPLGSESLESIMDTSYFVADCITNGVSVMVECSNGLDRTAQVCSVSSLILDPFYKTINGFGTLIKKDWLTFGLANRREQMFSALAQFLDCTSKMMQQQANSFEFNEGFVRMLQFCCKQGGEGLDEALKNWEEFVNPLYMKVINNNKTEVPAPDMVTYDDSNKENQIPADENKQMFDHLKQTNKSIKYDPVFSTIEKIESLTFKDVRAKIPGDENQVKLEQFNTDTAVQLLPHVFLVDNDNDDQLDKVDNNDCSILQTLLNSGSIYKTVRTADDLASDFDANESINSDKALSSDDITLHGVDHLTKLLTEADKVDINDGSILQTLLTSGSIDKTVHKADNLAGASDFDVNLINNEKAVNSEDADHLKKPRQKTANKEQTKNKPYSITWMKVGEFSIESNVWQNLQIGDKLKDEYAEHFVKILNKSFEDITCVLKSNGVRQAKRNPKIFSMRFFCTHLLCERQYKVVESNKHELPKFDVFKNATEINHENSQRSRQLRGSLREQVGNQLLEMFPQQYREKCEENLDQKLYAAGNLQDVKSDQTLKKIRQEALETFDYDKDDIFDLLKMKIVMDGEFKEKKISDMFIRRISLDPFTVTFFSNEQYDCLRKLRRQSEEITVHFDATGGVARHGAKTIYYYGGVTPVVLPGESTAKVLHLLGFVSGSHDTFNISLPLQEYKNEFHKKFPNDDWPINYVVTDFSMASLNAICHSWNKLQLITYINLIYKFANEDKIRENGKINFAFLRNSGIATLLQLCCSHFTKTFSNDVSRYFPNIGSKNQSILKEIFAGMCDTSDLNVLRTIWQDFSTLLLNKYITEEVQAALKNLAKIMTKADEENEDAASSHDADELRIDWGIDDNEPNYKRSLF